MNKIAIAFICGLFSLTSYSQVPFVHYETVPNNGNSNVYNRQQSQPHYQMAAGYYYDNYSQNFKRIKIKVNATSIYGQPQIYLKGIYNSQYNIWSDCDNKASKVDANLDGEVIANNFEWKVQALNIGIIYFNY